MQTVTALFVIKKIKKEKPDKLLSENVGSVIKMQYIC